jgi:hypothetical protein
MKGMIDMAKKKREDSFFGLHFDFHASPEQTGIGDNCDPVLIEKLIVEVKPDYIQCDTKGHPGISSYPTKAGNPAPEIKADILKMWRDCTEKYGVALYSHYSGVWDNEAAKNHPEWCAVNSKGETSKEKMSVFGPYLDELMIPQLKELALAYKMDGIWVDGDCWGTVPDYSSWAAERWQKKTGLDFMPKPEDEGYKDLLEFFRQGFRDYVNRYAAQAHLAAPDFQVASNWMYTSFVPEKPAIDIDFISGDYSPSDSVNTARFEARCIMSQNKPWDLMAWGFNIQDNYHVCKTAEQLKQEGAVVIALGGGFQIYNKQLAGTVQDFIIPNMKAVAEFAREREKWCFKAKAVPDVGVIYSTKGFYASKKNIFTCYGEKTVDDMKTWTLYLCDCGFSTEILMTHQILGRMAAYKLLVLPDWSIIEDELKAELLAYVANGGALIAGGPNAAKIFEEELGVKIGEQKDEPVIYIEQGNYLAGLDTCYAPVETVNAQEFGKMFTADNRKAPSWPAATIAVLGKGKIAGVYFRGENGYLASRSAAVRDFIASLALQIAKPRLRLQAPKCIDASLMEKDGRLIINLLNTAGDHGDIRLRTFDVIPPVYHIEVKLLLDKEPAGVTLQPGNKKALYSYADGIVKIEVEKLDIHTAIVIDFGDIKR